MPKLEVRAGLRIQSQGLLALGLNFSNEVIHL